MMQSSIAIFALIDFDSKMDRLTSFRNLELAWRRITTGVNYQYKRYFRSFYYAYETALEKNLKDLHDRLQGGGGSYEPHAPTRIYLPKPSGLQRPLTLLLLEDQIILQAIANRFASKLIKRRKPLQFETVFSNILQDEKTSIFFLQDWHYTYSKFTDKIGEHFNRGLKWIAHFDLAAYYDTISHDILLKTVLPRTGSSTMRDNVLQWLKVWSSERASAAYSHGIPQGPIASDFLAECFLLPIDDVLSQEFTYVRYVDDIRLFAASEVEAQRAAIKLEILCRERGLIPQGKKFAITKAASVDEALGLLPSIAPPNQDNMPATVIPATDAIEKFEKALDEKTRRITDKTRARYVLYHAAPSRKLLWHVIRLMPLHPEHIDVFTYYLSHHERSSRVIEACLSYLRSSPYEYVQGELWHILARQLPRNRMRRFITNAIDIAKCGNASFSLKWGVLHFLCIADSEGFGNYGKFVQYQKNALLQALLVPILPDSCYDNKALIKYLLKRSAFEPGIMLAEQFAKRQIYHNHFGVRTRSLSSQVLNIYSAVGIIQTDSTVSVDPVGEILSRRYRVRRWAKWKKLFETEYVHALQILCQADPVFDSGRSRWLSYQNSFNDALFRAIQKHLNVLNKPGAMQTAQVDGKLIDFGVLLDPSNPFSTTYPAIAKAFRETNARRNKIPGSHPYEKKGGAKTQHLRKEEQTGLSRKLAKGYLEIIKVFDRLIV
jgi:hypothetical protein